MNRDKAIGAVMGGILAVGVLGASAFTFAQSGTTQTASTAAPVQATGLALERGFMGGSGAGGEALAAALGIGVDELEAAQTAARDAMIDAAVANGDLTQKQADQLKAQTFGRGFRFHGGDNDTYLAEALGITVEELRSAEVEVKATQLATAVDEGQLTQEQADVLLARMAANAYLDRDALQAQVTAAYEAALSAAVADGAITQAQADALLAELVNQSLEFGGGFFGGRGDGHRGGPGGSRGFGGFGGFAAPDVPAPAPDAGTGA